MSSDADLAETVVAVDRASVESELDAMTARLAEAEHLGETLLAANGAQASHGDELRSLLDAVSAARASLAEVYRLLRLRVTIAPPEDLDVPIDVLLTELEQGDIIEEEPIAPDPVRVERARSIPPAPVHPPREGAPTVLVIDDDPEIRALICRALSTSYTVYEAYDGLRATEMLGRIPTPDAIVSDVAMPRLDGLGLARKIREDATLRRVPFLFVSAKDHAMDVVEGINVGARHYITKPFKLRDLTDKVASMIRRR